LGLDHFVASVGSWWRSQTREKGNCDVDLGSYGVRRALGELGCENWVRERGVCEGVN